MNNQPEFLACPFCGKYPDAFSNGDVTCSTEMCPGYEIMCAKSDWNTRPEPVPPVFETEALGQDFARVIEDHFTELTSFVKPTILKETNVGYAASSGATLPPAGDVEVLVDEDTLRDLSSSACQSALCDGINEEAFARLARTVEQRCRASITRLTAERDRLENELDAAANWDAAQLKVIHGLNHEVAHYLQQIEQMESELTKARELLTWFYSHSNVAQVGTVMMNAARDYLAHQSAPAAKGGE